MAKLPQGTTCETMNSLAGKLDQALDFYFWKGIPCVRKWPKWRRSAMTDSQIAASAAFAAAVGLKATILPEIKDNFKVIASGTTQTWADVLVTNAMTYYMAGLGYAPAITAVNVEYGSGIKSITIRFDHPCAPVLQFYRGLAPVSYTKRFRGKTTQCKRPNRNLSAIAYKMTLDIEEMLPVRYVGAGEGKVLTRSWLPLLPCLTHLRNLLAEFYLLSVKPLYNAYGLVKQNLVYSPAQVKAFFRAMKGVVRVDPNPDSVWEGCPGRVGDCQPRAGLVPDQYGWFYVEPDGSFTDSDGGAVDTYFYLDSYDNLIQHDKAPLTAENINGASCTLFGWCSPTPPDGFFTCNLFGGALFDVPFSDFSRVEISAAKAEKGKLLEASFTHSHYPNMPAYPICDTPDINMEAYIAIRDVSVALGPRWEYTFRFPRTLKPGIDIYCSFIDAKGNFVLMYPVTVAYFRKDKRGWGELMANPWED